MNDQSLNVLFDKVILSDSKIIVNEVDLFSVKLKISLTPTPLLSYSSKMKLWDQELKNILDNPAYSEKDKIQFLEAAINDTSRDALHSINSYVIDFWHTSPEAEKLIGQYFANKKSQSPDDPYRIYDHLRFKTKNLIPGVYEMITDYFSKRESLRLKSPYEGELILGLIYLGKEEEAIGYLELLIDDFLRGKIHHLPLGSRIGDVNLFDLLCLSERPEIAKKATSLLYFYLAQLKFDAPELDELLYFLDRDKYLQISKIKFENYAALNFSVIDLADPNVKSGKERFKVVPNALNYFYFMSSNAYRLGEYMGRALWQEFVKKMPYWEKYDGFPFESHQMCILESSFKDKSLTLEELRSMLCQVKQTKRFFRDGDYYGNWGDRFLRLVKIAYPNGVSTRQDFDKLDLGQRLTYTSPLRITIPDMADPRDNSKVEELINDLILCKILTQNYNLKLSNYDRFIFSLKSLNTNFNSLLEKSQKITWFDAESSEVPTNYVDFFIVNFLPLLEKVGIEDIEVFQNTRKYENDEYGYEIQVKSDERAYKYTYKEPGTDWYQSQRLVKMINLLLIQKKTPYRLIEIETGDQTAKFGIFEPSILKPLLDKYGINCWAIHYEDQFNVYNTQKAGEH